MVDYNKLTYGGKKVQVESAVRDGQGATIHTHYVKNTTTVNNKALSSNVTLDYTDVSAIKRGSYERIEGTSASHKDLNSYITAGFYNVKGLYVDNCPLTGDVDYYLLVMPWNTNKWVSQIIVTGNYATANYNKMWIRSSQDANAGNWSAWNKIASISDIPSIPVTSVNNKTGAVILSASDVNALASSTTFATINNTSVKSNTAFSLVPTTRKVNNKALSSDISLTASDVSALASNTSFATINSTSVKSNTAFNLVPTSRKINGTALTSDINVGTVTSVATGVGLTGGTITGTGTIKAYLKSETKATYDSNAVTNVASRQFAVVPDNTGYLSVNVPHSDRIQKITDAQNYLSSSAMVSSTTNDSHFAWYGRSGSSTSFTDFIINCTASDTNMYLIGHGKTLFQVLSDSSSALALSNYKGYVYAGQFNNYTLNNACSYDIETTLANDSKLPTGSAVTAALSGYVPASRITISSSTPSGGSDGDIWIQYS